MIETRRGASTYLIGLALVVVPLVAKAVGAEPISRAYMQVDVGAAAPVPPNERIHVLVRLIVYWYVILGSKLCWRLRSQAKDEVAARSDVVARANADYCLALVGCIPAARGHVPRAHSLQATRYSMRQRRTKTQRIMCPSMLR